MYVAIDDDAMEKDQNTYKKMKPTSKKIFKICILLIALLFCLPSYAISETVTLPLSIDYQILRSLVIKNAFTDSNQTAVLMDENNGCQKIVISKPFFREKDAHVLFESKVSIRMGVVLFKNCMMPVEWEGYLTLIQRPRIDEKWILSFETLGSAVYDKDRKPAKIVGIIWEYVKTSVYEYLESITINLAPPVSELKSFFMPLFPPDLKHRAQKMVDSMRPGPVKTIPHAIRVNILTEVDKIPEEEEESEPESLTDEQWARFIDHWETWDAFLVHMILSLAKEPLTVEDRQILLDVLLETRHRFIQEFETKHTGEDFVRQQFVAAWKKLSKVFRNHLSDDPSKSVLSYLAFFTASDAIITLDRIGPALGIEISRNGLIRLARLTSEGESVILEYRPGVNVLLREILGLGAPLAASKTSSDEEEIKNDPLVKRGELLDSNRFQIILSYLFRRAWAGQDDESIPSTDLKEWIFSKRDLTPYLEKIKALLADSSVDVLRKSKLRRTYHKLYRLIVLATAWQESCYRQFKEKNDKVIYLRSYDGSSVGLMQINERVWRGIYEERYLRWDIKYNTLAGCEILDLYFHRYALRKMKTMQLENALDDETLARAIYAMYNGGPGQFKKYLKRHQKKDYYSTDRLFFEKYEWVSNGHWEKIGNCLIGS